MKNIIIFLLIALSFNACSTKKVCTDCTTRIPEPDNLENSNIKKFNPQINSRSI